MSNPLPPGVVGTPNAENDRHMEWLLEQVDAAKDIIHLHRCVSCQIATAQTPMILVTDLEDGCRITIVGICNTCNTEEGKQK